MVGINTKLILTIWLLKSLLFVFNIFYDTVDNSLKNNSLSFLLFQLVVLLLFFQACQKGSDSDSNTTEKSATIENELDMPYSDGYGVNEELAVFVAETFANDNLSKGSDHIRIKGSEQ